MECLQRCLQIILDMVLAFVFFWRKYKIPGTLEDYVNKMELLRNIKLDLPSFWIVNVFKNS